MNISDKINEFFEDMGMSIIKMDGFDDCILGYCTGAGSAELKMVYSVDKILAKLVSEQEMDMEEALEYFNYNMESAYVGEGSPVFFYNIDGIDLSPLPNT